LSWLVNNTRRHLRLADILALYFVIISALVKTLVRGIPATVAVVAALRLVLNVIWHALIKRGLITSLAVMGARSAHLGLLRLIDHVGGGGRRHRRRRQRFVHVGHAVVRGALRRGIHARVARVVVDGFARGTPVRDVSVGIAHLVVVVAALPPGT
jgi:hypothetical protein